MIYPWQTDDWTRLQQLRAHWPHALLLHGQAGIGKLQLRAASRARAAVRSPAGRRRAVRRSASRATGSARAIIRTIARRAGGARRRSRSVTRPRADRPTKGRRRRRQENARAQQGNQDRAGAGLLDFCGVGSHRGGARVVVLYPAEALNVAAANALLKTLEEPPAGVVFLMVSARVDRLLPTIISRCRQWPMTLPPPESAVAWLARRACADPRRAARRSGRRAARPRSRSPPMKTAPLRDFDAGATRRRRRLRRLRVRREPAEAARADGARLAATLALRLARAAHGGRVRATSRTRRRRLDAARARPTPRAFAQLHEDR